MRDLRTSVLRRRLRMAGDTLLLSLVEVERMPPVGHVHVVIGPQRSLALRIVGARSLTVEARHRTLRVVVASRDRSPDASTGRRPTAGEVGDGRRRHVGEQSFERLRLALDELCDGCKHTTVVPEVDLNERMAARCRATGA